eukprot:366076-Hanusia_phi.AAC.1
MIYAGTGAAGQFTFKARPAAPGAGFPAGAGPGTVGVPVSVTAVRPRGSTHRAVPCRVHH